MEEAAEQYKGLIDRIKNTLGDKVEKVVVSQRLADSPCALVTSKFGWSAHQERVMKSQVRPPFSCIRGQFSPVAFTCIFCIFFFGLSGLRTRNAS